MNNEKLLSNLKEISKIIKNIEEPINELKKELKSLFFFCVSSGIIFIISIGLFDSDFNAYKNILSYFLSLYKTNPIGTIGILITLFGVFISYFSFLTISEISSKGNERRESWVGAVVFFNNIIFLPLFTILIIFVLIKELIFIFNNSILLLSKKLFIFIFFLLLLAYQNKLYGIYLNEIKKFNNYNELYKLVKFRQLNVIKITIYSLPLVLMSISLLNMNISLIYFVSAVWIIFTELTFLSGISALNLKRCYLVDIKARNKIFRDSILIKIEENFIRFVPKPTKQKDLSSKLININDVMEIEYKK